MGARAAVNCGLTAGRQSTLGGYPIRLATFWPHKYAQRRRLLRPCGNINPLAITGGRVWVSFGAEFGDCSNYKGRVVGVRLDGTGDPVMFDPSTRRQGGIWNPAGPTVDAAGNLYVVSANGSSFPAAAYDHTNSVLELSPAGKLLDSFAPTDWAQNNEGDVGLGSQGVALIGTKWAVLGGKSGPVCVLRQGHLGGIGGQVSATEVCLPYGGAAVDGSVVYLP